MPHLPHQPADQRGALLTAVGTGGRADGPGRDHDVSVGVYDMPELRPQARHPRLRRLRRAFTPGPRPVVRKAVSADGTVAWFCRCDEQEPGRPAGGPRGRTCCPRSAQDGCSEDSGPALPHAIAYSGPGSAAPPQWADRDQRQQRNHEHRHDYPDPGRQSQARRRAVQETPHPDRGTLRGKAGLRHLRGGHRDMAAARSVRGWPRTARSSAISSGSAVSRRSRRPSRRPGKACAKDFAATHRGLAQRQGGAQQVDTPRGHGEITEPGSGAAAGCW